MMFDIFTPKEWMYASICFIVGLITLCNISINYSIPSTIIFLIDIIGATSLFLYLREQLNEQLKTDSVK